MLLSVTILILSWPLKFKFCWNDSRCATPSL